MRLAVFLAVWVLAAFPASSAESGKKTVIPSPRAVTLRAAVSTALKQNPEILRALREIERTRGQIIEVRAQALPQIVNTASYNQQDPRLFEVSASALTAGGFRFIQDKSWQIDFQVRQLIYSGGQVQAAVKVAKLAEDTSHQLLRETVNRVIATVRTQFYAVLLNRELITVSEESIQLLSDQLRDQQNRFAAGTVPRFNVLQAEVALANARPELIVARNNYLIARLQLARTLGLDANSPVDASGSLQANPRTLNLSAALKSAMERRALLKAQDNTVRTEKESITIAKAGYKPQLNVTAGWQLRNSRVTDDLTKEANGWIVGVTGNWNIFDGLATKGRMDQAAARLASAKVGYADSIRQVELEVQTAFANVSQSREVIASQSKVVEQATEAIRLAKERLAAGAGTQLDVLSAEVALTQARTTQKQALASYHTAIAEFDRATGAETVYEAEFPDPRDNHFKASLRRGKADLRPAD
ncbi:MAG: TolC family protein [Chthoniobacteraceae bacterium]